jgi:hypothetical protein
MAITKARRFVIRDRRGKLHYTTAMAATRSRT